MENVEYFEELMREVSSISENGRHLGIMPHPERCILDWQVPWKPDNVKPSIYTPWVTLFQNAYDLAKK